MIQLSALKQQLTNNVIQKEMQNGIFSDALIYSQCRGFAVCQHLFSGSIFNLLFLSLLVIIPPTQILQVFSRLTGIIIIKHLFHVSKEMWLVRLDS